MTAHVLKLDNDGIKKAVLFFSLPRGNVQVEDSALAGFILISSRWGVSPAPRSAAIGSGLERWGGGYFNVNRTLKILPGSRQTP